MYQWNAADYAKHSQGQERWAQELLSNIELLDDEHVLDIGCGDGRTTAAIARHVPKGDVIGVDLSQDMIMHARDAFKTVSNLSFQQADAAKLPFDSQFTFIFSNATLHWVRDHCPVLAGISRALKPHGRVLAQMGGKGNGETVIAAFEEVMQRDRWHHYFVGFESTYGFHDPDDYRQWLHEAGLTPTVCKLIPKDMIHASVAEFSAWVRTAWLPYTSPVPAELREQFIDEATQSYVRDNPVDEQGRVHVPMMRLEVHAHKA